MMSLLTAPTAPFTSEQLIGTDRRRSARELTITRGVLRAVDASLDEPPQHVDITNLSLVGAGIRSGLPLEDGSFYQVEIDSPPIVLSSRIRIVHCSLHASGGYYEVGGEFC
jgi:hypothetical protein